MTSPLSQLPQVVHALSTHLPAVLRWAGAIARQLRQYNISLTGAKTSGYATTDALTLADITLQELIVSALRDIDPVLRNCRLEAEESNGDLAAFAAEGPLTLTIDPIDGTKQFRDRTANGYCVIVTLRSVDTLHYSLVYLPESGPQGRWVEVVNNEVRVGPDDPRQPARMVLDALPVVPRGRPDLSPRIYLIGFQGDDPACAAAVTQAGLEGVIPDGMPDSIYPLFADGEFAGSLIHTPNVYDFPVSLQIARALGGDAVWCHNGQAVHFGELWMDERAGMLRLPGIVACAVSPTVRETLVQVAQDWSLERYKS